MEGWVKSNNFFGLLWVLDQTWNFPLANLDVSFIFSVRQVHPGRCPAHNLVQLGSGGACFSECLADDDCLDTQKCCFNGCGLSCVTVSAVIPSKQSYFLELFCRFGNDSKTAEMLFPDQLPTAPSPVPTVASLPSITLPPTPTPNHTSNILSSSGKLFSILLLQSSWESLYL